jgi:hypothetical protein
LISQVHVNALEELDFSRLDPSLCVGFYFKTREEFEAFTVQCRNENAAKLKAGKTPIVYVEHAAPSYVSACDEMDFSPGKCESFDSYDGVERGSATESCDKREKRSGKEDVREEDDEYIMI